MLAVLEKTKEKGHKPDKYIKNKKKTCHRRQNQERNVPQKTKPQKYPATENKKTKKCHATENKKHKKQQLQQQQKPILDPGLKLVSRLTHSVYPRFQTKKTRNPSDKVRL